MKLPAVRFKLVSVMIASPAACLSSLLKLSVELGSSLNTVPLYSKIRSAVAPELVLMVVPRPTVAFACSGSQSAPTEYLTPPLTSFTNTCPDCIAPGQLNPMEVTSTEIMRRNDSPEKRRLPFIAELLLY